MGGVSVEYVTALTPLPDALQILGGGEVHEEHTLEVGAEIALAVENRRLPTGLLRLLSSNGPICSREGQCWDFKRDQILDEAVPLAELCKDIAGFFNAFGGFIILGVEEVEKDLRFEVVGIGNTSFPMQRVKGLLSKYLSEVPDISYDEYEVHKGDSTQTVAAIAIPKRPQQTPPTKFLTRGPEKRKRPIFDADQLAVRRGDQTKIVTSLEDWQLVSSDRTIDRIGIDLGRISPAPSALKISHNLPTRSAICKKFIGRRDYLEALWGWLNDEFQYCRVIAGDGGKGKTSLAYEFATQVAKVAPCGFERIVWLTAKKRQFHAQANEWREMHETHFQCFRSLLEVVGENLGYFPEELEEMTDAQLNRTVRQAISIQPTLFIFDDLDSLSPDDQKRALEFASQVGRPDVRFLLTTRANASYSSDLCLTLRGLDRHDFDELLNLLLSRYEISLPSGVRASIHTKTDGSPLLLDSILRLVARGADPRAALKEWVGAAGEDARRAVLQKEIDLLSVEARRVLLCIAFFGQCSLAEVQHVCALPAMKLEDCLRELESLFLVDAPKIIESQPRYEMNSTAIALVLSQKEGLAFDHAKIQRLISSTRAPLGKRKSARDRIGRAISQAIALAREKNYKEALETVDASLKSNKGNGDLLLLRARLGINSGLRELGDCRRDLREAYHRGCRKPLLFDIWLSAERQAKFGPGIIEVCDYAVEVSPDERATWAAHRAEGHVLNGLAHARSGSYTAAADELSLAADCVYSVVRDGENEVTYIENLRFLHDRIIQYRVKDYDMGLVIDAVRDAIKRGDSRASLIEQALSASKRILGSAGPRSSRTKDWVVSQCELFAAGLRASEGESSVLAGRFDALVARATASATAE